MTKRPRQCQRCSTLAWADIASCITRHSAFGIPSCLRISCFVICPVLGRAGGGQEPAVRLPTGTAESRPRILAAPFASPRQLLRLLDIGESDLSSFRDGQPIGPDDLEALIKILYRMPQIGWDEIDRWQHADVPWTAAAARIRQCADRLLPAARARAEDRASSSDSATGGAVRLRSLLPARRGTGRRAGHGRRLHADRSPGVGRPGAAGRADAHAGDVRQSGRRNAAACRH